MLCQTNSEPTQNDWRKGENLIIKFLFPLLESDWCAPQETDILVSNEKIFLYNSYQDLFGFAYAYYYFGCRPSSSSSWAPIQAIY